MSSFLKIGATFAVTQSSGSTLVERDWLNIEVRTGAVFLESSYGIVQGMSSGPDALLTLSFPRSFLTPAVLMVPLCPRVGVNLGLGVGRLTLG